jgi:hypothetical protein
VDGWFYRNHCFITIKLWFLRLQDAKHPSLPMHKSYGNWIWKAYAEFYEKVLEMYPKAGPQFDNIQTNTEKKVSGSQCEKWVQKKSSGPEVEGPRPGHPGPICTPVPGGPWAQYIRTWPVGTPSVLGFVAFLFLILHSTLSLIYLV